jgi:hypothetical protein
MMGRVPCISASSKARIKAKLPSSGIMVIKAYG